MENISGKTADDEEISTSCVPCAFFTDAVCVIRRVLVPVPFGVSYRDGFGMVLCRRRAVDRRGVMKID